MPKFRVLVTGGGTGGHIYPIISVVSELQILCAEKKINLQVRYLGAYGAYQELLRENNIEVQGLAESKLRRYFAWSNFIAGPKFIVSLLQALSKMFCFMPEVVFSKGGPGALAVILVARFYRIPVIIHESDSIPGITNLLSARFAKNITCAFNSALKYFPTEKTMVVGNPVRRYLFSEQMSQTKAKGFLEFDINLPLLLVLGGSQGSTRINDFIVQNLPQLLEVTQIFHQTGKGNYETVLEGVQNLPSNMRKSYRAVDYFEKDMRIAMQAADVVLSRAGAGSIFEIAAFGKPSILVPLREAASNHQFLNATEYAVSGAALVMEEANLTPELFLEKLRELLNNKEKLSMMGQAALQFSRPEAASNLAKIILKLGGYT